MVITKKTSSSRRKYILLSILLVVIIASGASAIALRARGDNDKNASKKSTNRPVNSVNYSPSKQSDNQTNDTRKASPTPSNTLNDQSSPPTGTPLTATIVNASVNTDDLHVGTLVNGATSGSCTLSASQNNTQINLATATIQRDVNSYDCGVFNIPTTRFPSSGNWKLTLAVTGGGQQANTSANVTIPGGS